MQCPSDESRARSANVVFYILCLLYVLCAASVVCDLLAFIFEVSNKFIYKNIIFIISSSQLRDIYPLSLQLQIDLQPILNRIVVVEATVGQNNLHKHFGSDKLKYDLQYTNARTFQNFNLNRHTPPRSGMQNTNILMFTRWELVGCK